MSGQNRILLLFSDERQSWSIVRRPEKLDTGMRIIYWSDAKAITQVLPPELFHQAVEADDQRDHRLRNDTRNPVPLKTDEEVGGN